jgi:hypothetical protein
MSQNSNTTNLSRRAALAGLSFTAMLGAVAFPRAPALKELAAGLTAAEKPYHRATGSHRVWGRRWVGRLRRRLAWNSGKARAPLHRKQHSDRPSGDLDDDPENEASGFHECLTDAREYAEELIEFLTAAEIRFAVAMAVTAIEDNGHVATVHHGDMREIERLPPKLNFT